MIFLLPSGEGLKGSLPAIWRQTKNIVYTWSIVCYNVLNKCSKHKIKVINIGSVRYVET